MLDVTVKTLDGKNRSFSIPDDITVKQFKEKIAGSIEIPPESQRLIFQGRVLQDDKNLNHYDVNGKTLHVVQRAPPSSRPTPTTSNNSNVSQAERGGEIRSFVGSFTLPSDVVDPNQVRNIVQNVLSGMGDVGRNARISTSSSNDGSSVDVHINLGQIGPGVQLQSESQNRIRVAQRMISQARQILNRLDNPPNEDNEDIDAMDVTPTDDQSPPGGASTPDGVQPSVQPGTSSQGQATNGGTPTTGTAEGLTPTTGTAEGLTPTTGTAEGLTPTTGTAEGTTPTIGTAEGTTPTTGTAEGTNGTSLGEGSTQTDPGVPARAQNPNTPVLADLLSEVFEVNRRLQPYLERYQQFMRDDPSFENDTEEARSTQRLVNGVSGVMHYVSHAYHSISDLMVDTRQLPPRSLRSHPVAHTAAHPAAIIQQTIPVQAQISVAHISPHGSPPLQRRADAATTTPSTTAPTSTPSQQTAQNPPQPNVRMGMPFQFGMPPGMPGMPPGMPPPGAFGPGGQPVMFMELGPQGFHINSISAQVVTAANSTSTSSSTSTSTASTTSGTGHPAGPQPPPAGPLPTPAAQQPPPAAPQQPVPAQNPAGFPLPPGAFQVPPGSFGMPSGAVQIGGAPQFMPPNFLQNIIQMATGQAMGRPPVPGQAGAHQVIVLSQGSQMPGSMSIPSTAGGRSSTTTSSATSRASSTGSTQTNATQPGMTPPGTTPPGAPVPGQGARPRAAFVIPGPHPGLMPPGMMPSVDPYLPCQSRFFLVRRLGAAMPNGQPAEGQADQALSRMVSSIVSSIVNQTPNLAGMDGAQAPVPSTQVAGAATNITQQSMPTPSPANPFAALLTPAMMATAAAPGTNGAPRSNTDGTQPAAIEQLRNLLQMGRPQTSSTQSQSTTSSSSSSTSQSASISTTTSQPSSRSNPMGDEMFAQLVSGIGNYVSQAAMGQQASDSIYDFVNALGQDYGGANEGLLTDIFVCVSRHLTIVDLMSIFCHQTASLQRLIQPLQEFVRERILQGQEGTEENIDSAVERIIEEMLPQVEEICTDATVCDNIDFPASVQELLRLHLVQNSQLILNAQENDPAFGDALYNNIQSLLQEFLVLSGCCLEGGQTAVNRLVQVNVQRISSDINPMIQMWMTSMTTQQLQSITTNMTVTREQVERYIVRRADMDTSQQSQSSEASFMSAESGDKDQEVTVNGATAAMVTEVPECECNDKAKDSDAMDVEDDNLPSRTRDRDHPIPVIPPTLLQHVPPPPQVTDEVPVIVGSENWHSQVPQDWVHVITQDSHRQQHLPTQPSFSDAYINGMPPKRRKLMNHTEEATELADIRTLLPQAISRAAEATGAKPITSQEDMEKDASGSTTLKEAFQQEMDDSIRKRIHNDSDYIPEKYPNAEKYFKDKKK